MIPLVLCDKCRKPMSAVRPGKWQCDCETAGMPRMTDEELFRMAEEVFGRSSRQDGEWKALHLVALAIRDFYEKGETK